MPNQFFGLDVIDIFSSVFIFGLLLLMKLLFLVGKAAHTLLVAWAVWRSIMTIEQPKIKFWVFWISYSHWFSTLKIGISDTAVIFHRLLTSANRNDISRKCFEIIKYTSSIWHILNLAHFVTKSKWRRIQDNFKDKQKGICIEKLQFSYRFVWGSFEKHTPETGLV